MATARLAGAWIIVSIASAFVLIATAGYIQV